MGFRTRVTSVPLRSGAAGRLGRPSAQGPRDTDSESGCLKQRALPVESLPSRTRGL